MASLGKVDHGEFWLPPQFLDDDVLVEKKMSDGFKNTANNSTKASFSPLDFSYGFNASGINSPVESSLVSGDSNEDDIVFTGLAKKLAHSTLQDDFPSVDKTSKGCGCRRVSPNGDFEGVNWDLLYAAAGEVAKIRMNQQLYACYNNYATRNAQNEYFAPPRKQKHSPISPPLNNNTNNSRFPHLALFQKLQAAQFYRLRQQQMMERAQQYRSHAPLSHNRVSRPNTAGNACPSLTQTQTKRECAGTGVFLPCRVGTSSEPRRKQARSTDLLPAKVMQGLSLNMDDVDPTRTSQAHQARFNNGEERISKPQQVINLPSEWTY